MNYYNTLFNEIARLESKYIDFWVDVCNTESPTNYKEGVDKVGNLFIDVAKKFGWDYEIFPLEVSGDCVCITMNPTSTKKPITLSGHMDTVHPVGSFGNPATRIEGNRIYGPGVSDCKGGLVASLYAMEVLHNCNYTDRPIMLLLQSDEECNSRTSNKASINFICKKAKDSIAFINCEAQRGESAILYRKGILAYKLTIKGKSAHASKCYNAVNPICEAAHKILEFEKYKNEDGITCSCDIINSGTVSNVVPDECSLTVDFRYSTKEEAEYIKKTVYEIANTSYLDGTTCEVEQISNRVAMFPCERNINLLNKMNEIFKLNNMPTLIDRLSTGGSDAAEVTEYGIPCVDSVGVLGDFVHTKNEYAEIPSLAQAAKRIAAVIYGLKD